MKIENIREKMKGLDVCIEEINLTSEEAERQNKEQEDIQRAYDALYDL